MKKYLICILFLLSNITFKVHACGFYPHGIRYCFTHSEKLGLFEFSEFNYSPNNFHSKDIIDNDLNVDFWFNYCNKEVSKKAIKEAVYKIPYRFFTMESNNQMTHYLHKNNDLETFKYLKFAKKCELKNARITDHWERDFTYPKKTSTILIEKAEELHKVTKNSSLKKRYIFIAIRLAFYKKEYDQMIRLFDTYFANETDKDLIYYWSLYFRTKAEKNESLKSYYAAQVFANSAEKRFPVFSSFNFDIASKDILSHAKNKNEKANIHALIALKKHEKSLTDLKKIVALDNTNEILPFLILREINKLEDWILTPYFSLFDPSMRKRKYKNNYDDFFSYEVIHKRIYKDRLYAKEVLNFIKTLPPNLLKKDVWRVFNIQLLFLTENYALALKEITSLEKKVRNSSDIYQQIEKTKALCLMAIQKKGFAKLTPFVKKVILKNTKDTRFTFSIARLLEYKGNKNEACLLFYTIEREGEYGYGEHWKSNKNKRHSYVDYFDNYFDYINVMYTVKDVEKLITTIHNSDTKKDAFSIWLYKDIKKEIPKLYDLAGTMYIRKNELKKALTYFNKLDDAHWEKTAYLWGQLEPYNSNKSRKRDFQNPFYKLNRAPRFINEKETFELNKKTVTAKLIEYLEKTKTAKNKDYYYFLIANCYFNMTCYGNSWMMRRYGISAYDTEPYPEDEIEFRTGTLAKKYYSLAFEHATNDKFKAFCLRMAGQCEYFKLLNKTSKTSKYAHFKYSDSLFNINKFYKKLNTLYPEEEHVFFCVAFEDYFKPSSED